MQSNTKTQHSTKAPANADNSSPHRKAGLRLAAIHPTSEAGLPEVERRAREERRKSYVSPDTELRDYYVSASSIFERPFDGGHVDGVVQATVRRIHEAAEDDPDAIVVLGGIEPGVRIAREQIRHIPIVGTGQSAYQVALQVGSQVGHKLGILVYEPSIIEPMKEQGRFYGIDWMVTDMRSIDIPLPELYGRRPEVRERMIKVAREMVSRGATMVFPQGLSMMPATMSAEELSNELNGVPVLNGKQIAICTAEMLARLDLLKRAGAQARV